MRFRIRSLAAYRELFRNAGLAGAVGEATPGYLGFKGAAEMIRSHIPHVRLIAVLRNPVERAYSHYLML